MNDDSFTKIFLEYYTFVCNIVKYKIYASDDIEDCIQEVFLVTYQTADFENPDLIPAFLARTAGFKVKEYNRRYLKHKKRRTFDMDMATQYDLENLVTDNLYVERAMQEIYIRLQLHLTDEEMQLYKMKFVQKCSTSEIAKVLHIQYFAANTRIWRLKRHIRSIIDDILDIEAII